MLVKVEDGKLARRHDIAASFAAVVALCRDARPQLRQRRLEDAADNGVGAGAVGRVAGDFEGGGHGVCVEVVVVGWGVYCCCCSGGRGGLGCFLLVLLLLILLLRGRGAEVVIVGVCGGSRWTGWDLLM